MNNSFALIRTLLIYSICLPLAVFVGYVIASPDPLQDYSTYIGVGLVLFILMLPLVLRWHRALLLASWSGSAVLYFIPGRPALFVALAWLSFTIAVLQFVTNPKLRFISVPSITRPLIFIFAVVIGTALLTGGIGFKALGSETLNGRKYLVILTGMAAYFALVSQPVPPGKAALYVTLFFASSVTALIGDAGVIVAPGLRFIFLIFPMSEASANIIYNHGFQSAIERFGGIAIAADGICLAMLARYGITGIFDPRRLFRLGLFVTLCTVCLFGGFRSILLTLALTFTVLCYFEGIPRSRLFPLFVLGFALLVAVVIGFSDRMPLNMQRSLTIVPGLDLDSRARESAESSSEWRLQMWRELIPEIPRYLFLGKGFSVAATELNQQVKFTAESSALASDFHSGPLSVIIPFGIWGVIGLLWFWAACIKALYRNYRFGAPYLQKLNTFLFTIFIVKIVLFLFIFGDFASEFSIFAGIIGLSIAINAGVAKPAIVPRRNANLRTIRIRPRAANAIGTA